MHAILHVLVSTTSPVRCLPLWRRCQPVNRVSGHHHEGRMETALPHIVNTWTLSACNTTCFSLYNLTCKMSPTLKEMPACEQGIRSSSWGSYGNSPTSHSKHLNTECMQYYMFLVSTTSPVRCPPLWRRCRPVNRVSDHHHESRMETALPHIVNTWTLSACNTTCFSLYNLTCKMSPTLKEMPACEQGIRSSSWESYGNSATSHSKHLNTECMQYYMF